MVSGEVKAEDPIAPRSALGIFKSSQFVVKNIVLHRRPCPQITFGLVIILWGAYFYNLSRNGIAFTSCLEIEQVMSPQLSQWSAWLLHILSDLTAGRTFLVTLVLIVLGYYEHEIGGIKFLGEFLVFHYLLAFLFLYFELSVCYSTLEFTLFAFVPVFYTYNPIVRSGELEFEIEPRWHYTILIAILLYTIEDSEFDGKAVAMYFTALLVGLLYVFRQPSAWKNLKLNLLWMKQLFFFATLAFLPITTSQLAQWEGYTLLEFVGLGAITPEAFALIKISICFAPFLALTVDIIPWLLRAVYAVVCALLVMNSMNLPLWANPGPGFIALIILGFAFCK